MSASTSFRDALPPGTRLGQFELVEVLGRGGFGITYRGRDTSLDVTVAIKEYMPLEMAVREPDGAVYPRTEGQAENYAWGLGKFEDEAKRLARLTRELKLPGIVPVHHIFDYLGTTYIVMEYLEGRTLAELYESEGTLGEERLRGLLSSVLEALEHVHAAGIWHCDITPGNIMLRDDETPVLIDFGAAQVATAEHSRMVSAGTPGYSPLELYIRSGGKLGPWTDIYGVGAVLYRGITGTAPSEALARVVSDDLAPVAQAVDRPYGEQLTRAVDWALRVRGSERPQSIEAWREVLNGRGGVPGGGTEEVPPSPESPEPPRGKRWPAVAGIVALLAVAGGVWWWNGTPFPSPPVVPEVRVLPAQDEPAGARAHLDEARERGLDDEAHTVVAREIDKEEVARKLTQCNEHKKEHNWSGLRECANQVRVLEPDNAEAEEYAKTAESFIVWRKAKDAGSVEGWYEFMRANPDHAFFNQAEREMEKLEGAYWWQVTIEDTPEAYKRYERYFPEGRYVDEARRKM